MPRRQTCQSSTREAGCGVLHLAIVAPVVVVVARVAVTRVVLARVVVAVIAVVIVVVVAAVVVIVARVVIARWPSGSVLAETKGFARRILRFLSGSIRSLKSTPILLSQGGGLRVVPSSLRKVNL